MVDVPTLTVDNSCYSVQPLYVGLKMKIFGKSFLTCQNSTLHILTVNRCVNFEDFLRQRKYTFLSF